MTDTVCTLYELMSGDDTVREGIVPPISSKLNLFSGQAIQAYFKLAHSNIR